MIHSLRKQGYTVLLARNDWDYIWHLYRQIPEQVKVIVGDPEAGGNTYLNFIKSDKRPNGFPAWKVSLGKDRHPKRRRVDLSWMVA